MKRYYLRIRIMLLTFTLGLASVFVFGNSLKYSNEVNVDLPKVNFKPKTILFSLPKVKSESSIMLSIEQPIDPKQNVAGASGGITCDEARKKLKNKKIKIPNCD